MRLYSFLALFLVSFLGFSQERSDLYQTAEDRKYLDSVLVAINEVTATSVDSAIGLLDEVIEGYKLDNYSYAYARCISLKAWYLNFQMRYEEGLNLGHEALDIQRGLNDSLGIGMSLNRIGLGNFYFERVDDALKYLNEALDYFLVLNDSSRLDQVYNNLGVIYTESGRSPEAIPFYKKSLQIRKNQNSLFWQAYSYYNIASAYSETEEADSVEHYFEKAVQTFLLSKRGRVPAMVHGGIAEWKLLKKEYREALEHAKVAMDKATEKNNQEMIFAITGILVNIYSEIEDYELAYKYQTELFEQKLRKDSLNNVARVSEIEEKFKNTEKLQEISQLKNERLEDKNQIQTLQLYILSILLIGLCILITYIVYYQRKRQKLALEKEKVDKRLAEIKLMALQSQMNPHFIFNCINTAQSFVLNNEKEAAYEYLSNFAKLLRLVLMNSSKAYISLEDEIKLLHLYIALEAIRFDDQFSYEIEVDNNLENGIYEVPGMIIQSFVENAILHGLNNLKGKKGKLSIRFKLVDELVQCEIIDNGIGREAAQKIKEQKKVHYPSAALPNISERIQLMREITKSKVSIEILDLKENGHAIGTHIILSLPVQ
jgi:tetratricopeptide (TPR) repeat protein